MTDRLINTYCLLPPLNFCQQTGRAWIYQIIDNIRLSTFLTAYDLTLGLVRFRLVFSMFNGFFVKRRKRMLFYNFLILWMAFSIVAEFGIKLDDGQTDKHLLLASPFKFLSTNWTCLNLSNYWQYPIINLFDSIRFYPRFGEIQTCFFNV